METISMVHNPVSDKDSEQPPLEHHHIYEDPSARAAKVLACDTMLTYATWARSRGKRYMQAPTSTVVSRPSF